MDIAALIDALAAVIRSIPRSELLLAAVGAMVLGWIGSMLARRNMALGGLLRGASSLGLGLILVTVVLQLSRVDPRLDVAVPQLGLPEQVVEGRVTKVPMASDGHFWVQATVNGVPAAFMVDTGATLTAISEDLAERAGLEPRRGGIPVMLNTANGTIPAKVASVGSLEFGNVKARDIDAVIAPNFGPTNVLGMNVLARLDSWQVQRGELILVPAASDRTAPPDQRPDL